MSSFIGRSSIGSLTALTARRFPARRCLTPPLVQLRNFSSTPNGSKPPPLATPSRIEIDPGLLFSRPILQQIPPALPVSFKAVENEPYWQKIKQWGNVSEQEFLSYSWQAREAKLYAFLKDVLPDLIPAASGYEEIRTRDAFIQDVLEGIKEAPMSIRLTPHILSVIDWSRPLQDPIRRQFIPMKSSFLPDHPMLSMDSLHETKDSPVPGLVHRYPDKVLFLATSVCPLYCRFCTRSYSVGGNTDSVTKRSFKPILRRWEAMLEYIANTEAVTDVVISGGDSYYLSPEQVRLIGERLLDIDHVKRLRFASKGLAVSPSRILDPTDTWADELIRLSNLGRRMGKSVALHTHFNHPNEITWVSRKAAQKLFENGVTVRNQSVLLKGVNDDVDTMKTLIRQLADNNIQPYYVYQTDMVKGVEDLRTPLQTILDLECEIRGSIAGFMTPQFVVDLPGGGGKRLAASYETYDRETGISTFIAPAVTGRGKDNKVYEYYDPLPPTKHAS
ncbi:kama family protein [Xylogone sp. PMI_703]|nr:kama family protein [Xylogone sp. PMI_703]